jgi:hypothetical protein
MKSLHYPAVRLDNLPTLFQPVRATKDHVLLSSSSDCRPDSKRCNARPSGTSPAPRRPFPSAAESCRDAKHHQRSIGSLPKHRCCDRRWLRRKSQQISPSAPRPPWRKPASQSPARVSSAYRSRRRRRHRRLSFSAHLRICRLVHAARRT